MFEPTPIVAPRVRPSWTISVELVKPGGLERPGESEAPSHTPSVVEPTRETPSATGPRPIGGRMRQKDYLKET